MAKGKSIHRDELITFEREIRATDGGGGFTHEWHVIGQAWAQCDWIGGSESKARGALRETQRYRFTILGAEDQGIEQETGTGIGTKDRIDWRGDKFNVRERPRGSQASGQLVEIVTESGVAQ
jgi:head-tail adaptor